ncbi:hypothetical protein Celaphus_00005163 [Cervus elaphus hippelaphus]|uniref:Mitoguardin 2 n=1 Tax=Cervus elaphus hippelaphus TaxID=46360 RepID=A0A212CWT7_CEREH|nr:hypothetical protein Celaphus_00005163 [Cervus elaphus hippelaphus]
MAFRRTEGMSMIQALAMTVAEIPVFLYTTFGQSAFSQLRLTPGLRKVLFATALGTVALALAAHQLKRRRRKKKQALCPGYGSEQESGPGPGPLLLGACPGGALLSDTEGQDRLPDDKEGKRGAEP